MPPPEGPAAPKPPDGHEPIDFGSTDNTLETALRPDQWDDPADFIVENNPFAFSPGQLNKMLNPKSLAAFYALGGLSGIKKGLRTDSRRGLGFLEPRYDLEDPMVGSRGGASVAGSATAAASRNWLLGSLISSRSRTSSAGTTSTSDATATGTAHAQRKRVFGENRLPERQTKSFFQLSLMAFDDRILKLLAVAAAISLALGLYYESSALFDWVEGVAILVAILIVVLVSAAGDWQKERRFAKLNRRKEERTVKVIRSGKTVMLSVHDILVGDVLHIEPGDLVPADGIYIEGHGLKCDESSATGESDQIRKMPAPEAYEALEQREIPLAKIDPFILSGAKVLEGVGTCLVTGVGSHSIYGRIMMSLFRDHEVERTLLQVKLDALARGISRLGLYAALVLAVVLCGRTASGVVEDIGFGQGLWRLFILAVKILFAVEGLPEVLSFVLVMSAYRFTRLLGVCRALRGAGNISSDKATELGKSECRWNDAPQKSPNRGVFTGPSMYRRSRFVLPLRIDKTDIDAIPDTGADENAISSACARRLGIKIERDSSWGWSSTAFRLANGRVIKSCGTASVPSLCFAKGNNSKKRSKDPVLFRVFDALAVPMILGRGFLKETETLSRYTNRLKKVGTASSLSSSIPRILHMNIAKERMLCYVNGFPVYANADTGAEMNLASPEWATRHASGSIQKPGRGYEEVMLADGSRARILGQFNARFQVHDGPTSAGKQGRVKTSTRRFFILDGLTSDILLCQDLLFDVRAFKEQQGSFVVLSAPASGSFSDVNFVAWLSKREKKLLGFFKGHPGSHTDTNTNTAAGQSEADFRAKLDDDDAREQHLRKHTMLAIDQLPEPERSRRLEAENKRHSKYLEDRERREREHSTVVGAHRTAISTC
ncbi:E1-E2 ATPase-domain-containing protein [Aspergillus carlsbadensis]|nr:E1-E2 ATPase-domain-containing protein [Aspergillus carlsbadensis]